MISQRHKLASKVAFRLCPRSALPASPPEMLRWQPGNGTCILGTWPLQLSVGRSFGISHFCLFGRRSCSAQFSLRGIGPTYIISSLVNCSVCAERGQATHSICKLHLQPLTGRCLMRHHYQGIPAQRVKTTALLD